MSEASKFFYNSNEEKLLYAEYGRNVQKLVRHANSIEDDEERQRYVEVIIRLVKQMNPKLQSSAETDSKIWRHFFHMTDYKLKVKAPFEMPDSTPERIRPEKVAYPDDKSKYGQYGKNVRSMIAKAIGMEDGETKTAYVYLIAAYMKLAYRNWNKDNPEDERIKTALEKLSDGKLTFDTAVPLDSVLGKPRTRKRSNRQSSNRQSSHGGRRRGGHHSNRRRR